jgi:cytoskeletal protein CcmA (bactofilin family)
MRNVNADLRPEPGDTVRVPVPPGMQQTFGQQQPPAHAPAAKKVAVLGPTLRFKGELSAEEDFILQGRIEGSINHTQSVTIGTEGSVLGDIHARVITIDGTVEGDLHGTDSVVVHETGKVVGNIFAPRVGIVEGALFNGRVEMGARAADASRPVDTQRASARRREENPPGIPMTAEETEHLLIGKK